MIDYLIQKYITDWESVKRPSVRKAYGNLAGIIGILVNIFQGVLKLIVGYMMGSLAVISDGFHNLADVGSAVASIISFRMSGKAPDLEHPYGHGRIEYLFSIGVSVVVMAVGIQFFVESFKKILDPEPVNVSLLGIILFAVSLLGTVFLLFMYRKIGRRINSKVLIAAGADSFSDLMTTAVIISGLLLEPLVGFPLDGYLGVVASLAVFHTGFSIFKDATSTLIGNEPSPDLVRNLSNFVKSYDGVIGIHDLMIHDYGPGHQFSTIHVEVDAAHDVIASHELIDKIEREAYRELGIQLTIHMDPLKRDTETLRTFDEINKIVKAYDATYSIHDLRMIHSFDVINILFDLVVPHDDKRSPKIVERDIKDLVEELNSVYVAKITIDYSYVGEENIHD